MRGTVLPKIVPNGFTKNKRIASCLKDQLLAEAAKKNEIQQERIAQLKATKTIQLDLISKFGLRSFSEELHGSSEDCCLVPGRVLLSGDQQVGELIQCFQVPALNRSPWPPLYKAPARKVWTVSCKEKSKISVSRKVFAVRFTKGSVSFRELSVNFQTVKTLCVFEVGKLT